MHVVVTCSSGGSGATARAALPTRPPARPTLQAANAFIAEGRAAGGVLVHCYAGQSRSAALVMAYLMATEHKGLVEAWAAVRRARPCARPNSGFLQQLAAYAAELGLEGAFEIA